MYNRRAIVAVVSEEYFCHGNIFTKSQIVNIKKKPVISPGIIKGKFPMPNLDTNS